MKHKIVDTSEIFIYHNFKLEVNNYEKESISINIYVKQIIG